jgi:hypothetical protein
MFLSRPTAAWSKLPTHESLEAMQEILIAGSWAVSHQNAIPRPNTVGKQTYREIALVSPVPPQDQTLTVSETPEDILSFDATEIDRIVGLVDKIIRRYRNVYVMPSRDPH